MAVWICIIYVLWYMSNSWCIFVCKNTNKTFHEWHESSEKFWNFQCNLGIVSIFYRNIHPCCHLTADSQKSIPHRGLFWVSMESQRSKYLSGNKFRVVGGLWVNLWRLKSTRAIMAPPPPGNVCSSPRLEYTQYPIIRNATIRND